MNFNGTYDCKNKVCNELNRNLCKDYDLGWKQDFLYGHGN